MSMHFKKFGRSAAGAKLAGASLLATALVARAPAGELAACFVPGQDCSRAIAAEIDQARAEVLVQAYGFSNTVILDALARAGSRPAMRVAIILDRSAERARAAGALALRGAVVLIDDRVTIAHSKVVVIDRDTVITGSFNFTESAQRRNAENVLIIHHDPELAAAYAGNWERRAAVARPAGNRP